MVNPASSSQIINVLAAMPLTESMSGCAVSRRKEKEKNINKNINKNHHQRTDGTFALNLAVKESQSTNDGIKFGVG
jgi:hypothetical protein